MDKKISIIIAVYNAEKYIERCVKSIVNQNYKNVEIILIDDGSKDNSPCICDNLKKKYPNIICVVHKDNGGCYSAWNKGLEIMTGDYVTFVDNDDIVHPNIYTNAISQLEKYDCDISVYNRIRFYNDNFSFPQLNNTPILHFYDNKQAVKHLFSETKYLKPAVWDKVYKKELFSGESFPNTFYEDAGLTYKLLYKAKKVVSSEDTLYGYYVHSGSMITTPWSENKFKSFFDVTNWASDYFDYCNEPELKFASFVWRMNFGIEAWYRLVATRSMTKARKEKMKAYFQETCSISNLIKMPVSAKRKMFYIFFSRFPSLIIKVLKIRFDL